jgi:diguanylate cyclase (GGDEF)-like protein
VDLEITALETHLLSAQGLPDGRLFVNLSATAFLDPRVGAADLARRTRGRGFPPERIVLELTELVRLPDPVGFAAALRPLREQGFLLAVDDFGAGFSNVQILVELGPDFVKIDRSLIAGASEHPRKRVFLESMGALGRRINCSVIGEGVETPEDLATLRACGIPFAQGWGVARPAPLSVLLGGPPPLAGTPSISAPPEEPVGSYSVPQEGVAPESRVRALVEVFSSRPEPPAVPVLRHRRARGLVTRNLLFSQLGHRYGFALWHERPVAEFLRSHGSGWDRLAASASLEDAAELVRRRPEGRRFDPIVVEDEQGDYHGLLPVDLLLTEMTRLKVEYALQSNPLTGLPGSVVLARVAEARMSAGQPFTLGWVDIDDFKPYNDRYGFLRGDEVLLLLAEIIRKQLTKGPEDFLAHPGGDDFAFLVEPALSEERSRAAAEEFSDRVRRLYDEPDREAGGITSHDRQGRSRQFPFLSISAGLVTWRGEPGVDYRRLVEVAAEVKQLAKASPGGAIVMNARALGPKTV